LFSIFRVLAILLLCVAAPAAAQGFPGKPVRGALGAEPVGSTPQEFAAFIGAESTRWGKVVRDAGIRAD
jgi:hypothetical protein